MCLQSSQCVDTDLEWSSVEWVECNPADWTVANFLGLSRQKPLICLQSSKSPVLIMIMSFHIQYSQLRLCCSFAYINNQAKNPFWIFSAPYHFSHFSNLSGVYYGIVTNSKVWIYLSEWNMNNSVSRSWRRASAHTSVVYAHHRKCYLKMMYALYIRCAVEYQYNVPCIIVVYMSSDVWPGITCCSRCHSLARPRSHRSRSLAATRPIVVA